jgi:glycosyltransferase involved in cell wall biosynthesis
MSLRILHIAEAYGGGVYEMVTMQAEGAARAGHTVAIAYGRRPETPADVRAAVDPAVEVFETPWLSRTVIAQVRAARYLRRLVRAWEPDVVHLQSSFAGVLGAALLRKHPAPLVYTPHGYAFGMSSETRWHRLVYRELERLVATHVDLVGTTSASEGEQARRDVRAPRVRIVENGIPDLDGELPPRNGDAAPAVRAIGRLRPQRQPESCARILEALSDLADVGWIGGGDMDGPEAQALEAAGVPVTGWLPREETLAELSRAQIYLHWTAWDGLPLSVLEAMARDVVVVASDIPANRELLGPEQVFGSEAGAIAAARAILSDPERRARCVESQRIRRRHYSGRRMIADWLAVYEDLARKAPA